MTPGSTAADREPQACNAAEVSLQRVRQTSPVGAGVRMVVHWEGLLSRILIAGSSGGVASSSL